MIPIRDINPNERPPLMTGALILTNLAVFGVEIITPESGQLEFFRSWALVPARYTIPDWAAHAGLSLSPLPFLTSMFLHGGWMHLIGNMWFLWLFGDNVEDRLGHWRYLGFYLMCGVVASLSQFMVDTHSTMPTLGASGAIAGVMGAYLLLFPRARILTLIPLGFFTRLITIPAWVFLCIWIAFQFVSGSLALTATRGEAGGIAFWAHIGGFGCGMILLRGVFERRSRRRPVA